jgi:hypothetical protein
MKNQAGFITLDFIFAVVLIFGMTGLLFAMSLTLSVASITQYITFSAARNYAPAHLDEETQKKQAVAKFKELVGNNTLAPLFKNGWFKLGNEPKVGDMAETIDGYKQQSGQPNLFWGVGTDFTAKILDFKIPFFGSTSGDTNGSDGFKTFMGSYLGRDVTTTECLDFVKKRWAAIQSLNSGYGTAQATYVAHADDGC